MADTDDTLRRLRHALRGAFSELLLCTEALRIETDPDAALEWLGFIEGAAERCVSLVDEFDALIDKGN